jgi:pyruvate dehydrogenase E1 component alpha subunit
MDPTTALELLKRMKRIRLVEETIAERYGQGEMRCPTHLCTGQEAVPAAVGMALRPDDPAVGTHRSHGHYLGKGGDLPRMLAEIYGKGGGCAGGRGGSMHLIDLDVGFMGSTAIVGGTLPVGVGLGLSIQLRGTDQVSCVFLGDGAVEEGVFYESVGFAALRRLPVLFVCENNFFSVYAPLAVRQPEGRSIHGMVKAIGLAGTLADSSDAVAVHALTGAALESIRRGEGPHFLEFETYRWREHCGPCYDDHLGYRNEDQVRHWMEKDPIRLLETRLMEQGVLDEALARQIRKALAAEVDEAFDFADRSAFPRPESAFENLYRSGEPSSWNGR